MQVANVAIHAPRSRQYREADYIAAERVAAYIGRDTEAYLRAIGVLASRGYPFQTRDPDILIIGNRAVAELDREGLIPEKELNGARDTGSQTHPS
jgi:hypothetical protein